MYGRNEELTALIERSTALPEMGYWEYDWEEFASFYDPQSRKFYWVEGSGCSCNSLWDDYESVGSMYVGSKEELLRAAAEFSDGRYDPQFQALRTAVSEIRV